MIAVVTFLLGKLGLEELLGDHLNAKIFHFQYNFKLPSVASEVFKESRQL